MVDKARFPRVNGDIAGANMALGGTISRGSRNRSGHHVNVSVISV